VSENPFFGTKSFKINYLERIARPVLLFIG
jgi:hypothetical protein